MKGGHAWYQLRIAASPIPSMGDDVDVLICFDNQTYETHRHDLQSHGVILYDPDELTPYERNGVVIYPVPFGRIARRDIEFPRAKNVVVVGAVAGLFGLDITPLHGLMKERFSRHPEAMEKNLQALKAGYDYATLSLSKNDPFKVGGAQPAERVVMNGNNAIVAGALAAGCRFFAGYPITPATEILEEMATVLPRIGGVCFQAEDELAALGAVLGASYGGVKAMTATSGPGLSLMTEFLSWSGMAEVPCVVVDVQRGGPGTGLPTKLEQSDLNHAIFGGHGDFPRVVLAASSVEDAFQQAINAFNIAEQYQLPVILLSDQSLSHRTETMPIPSTADLVVKARLTPTESDLAGVYKRYAITENGVSPMSLPGMANGGYVAAGLEHDERGGVTEMTDSHTRMMPKRGQKLESLRAELPAPVYHGARKARIGIVSWGGTEGAVVEAIEQVTADGIDVAALHLRALHPLNVEPLKEFASSVRRIVVPEANYSGQMARHIASHLQMDLSELVPLTKFTGLPLTAREIYEKVREVARDG
jgi:2-oxoglutarate ferredoxin oxidoreductase subunit alpha